MKLSRILMVDDSQADRFLLKRALAAADARDLCIDEAESADAAFVLLGEQCYSAVFLDIQMPGRDGFNVLERLRRLEPSNWPIVIMWSSSVHPDDVARSYREHANFFLQKPGSLSDLRDAVRRCVSLLEICASPSS